MNAPNILLTHGYFMEEDAKERLIRKPYPSLGLLYLASYLERAGIGVEVFDGTFGVAADLERRLDSGAPGIVGFSANLMTRANVVAALTKAKLGGWTALVGGPEAGSYADEYLAAGADAVVIGEGEATLAELVPALAAGRRGSELAAIAGLAIKGADRQTLRTAERAKLADLDALPWPKREAIDCGRYVATWRAAHGRGSLNVITARGCPYRCDWCSHGVYGFSHRRRSPADVAAEIQHLVERYAIDMLWIADDVFTIRRPWLVDFEREMRQRGLRVPFECISRADRLADEDLDLLAQLGCFRVWIGAESGSQRILDAMGRGVTIDEVARAVDGARRHGLETGMFLMWGYDGEGIEDIAATVEQVTRIRPDTFLTTVSYPIKGTGYYDKVAARTVPPADWSRGSDRDILVRGRHSRRYYDFASAWLRHEMRLARLQAEAGPLLARGRAFLGARVARIGLAISAGEVEA